MGDVTPPQPDFQPMDFYGGMKGIPKNPTPPDPTAQSTTSSDFDSYYAQLKTKYQDLQDQMTLSSLDGWAKRRKAIELWATHLKQEMTDKGVYTDEMATALDRVTTAEYAMIEASKKQPWAVQNTVMNEARSTMSGLQAQISAMNAGPKAFEDFEKLSTINTKVKAFAKGLVDAGVAASWVVTATKQYRELLNQFDEGSEKLDKFKAWSNTISSSLTGAFSKVSDYIVSSMLKGEASWKSFGDLALGIIEDIINALIRAAIIEPIVSGLTGSIMGAFTPSVPSVPSVSVVPSAKGNVFGSTGIVPYAKGGVVSQPTIFPFAHGTGLMGEKGSEAIMPLTRIGGDLGVKAVGMGGGGSSVIVNIMNNGAPMEVESQSQSTNGDGQTIIDLTVRQAISRLDGSGQLDGIFNRHGAKRVGGR
jgi:hypothetical protein